MRMILMLMMVISGCHMMGKHHRGEREDGDDTRPDENDSVETSSCTNLYDECVTNGVEQDICNEIVTDCEYNEQVDACEELFEDCIDNHIDPDLCGDMLDDCLSVDGTEPVEDGGGHNEDKER